MMLLWIVIVLLLVGFVLQTVRLRKQTKQNSCSHSNLARVFGDEINDRGCQLYCLDCRKKWNNRDLWIERVRAQEKAKRDARPRMTVLVSGSVTQANAWCRRNNVDPSSVIIATSANQLEGLRFKFNEVVFVGLWHNLKDIDDIMDLIKNSDVIMSNG